MKRTVIFPVLLFSVVAVSTIDGCHCNLRPPTTPPPKDAASLALDAAPLDADVPLDAEVEDEDALDTTCLLPPCFYHWSAPEWQAYIHQCIPVTECRTFSCPRWETPATFCNNPDGGVAEADPAAKAKRTIVLDQPQLLVK